MRDIGPLIVDSKRVDAAQRQLQRLGLEAPHACSGAGELPRAIEAVAVGGDRRRFGGLQGGISVLDFGALDHALEQEPRFLLGQNLICEPDESIVHVVLRNRGSNPVDVGGRHHTSPRRVRWNRSANMWTIAASKLSMQCGSSRRFDRTRSAASTMTDSLSRSASIIVNEYLNRPRSD